MQGAVSLVSLAPPHHMDMGSLDTADMDTAEDTPSNGDPDPANSPASPPLNISAPPASPPLNVSAPPASPLLSVSAAQSLRSPVQPPTEADHADHSLVNTEPEEVPRALPPFSKGLSPDPPPIHLSPDIFTSLQPNTPTPITTPTQPLLTSAQSGAFDLTGISGDFISESTCIHWESIPGGEKWVEMVKSYLRLEAMVPMKNVSMILCRVLS